MVGQEGIEFGERGRQTGEVESDATQQPGATRRRRRCETFPLQAGEDEAVDGVARPGGVADRRRVGAGRRGKAPVRLPPGALLDPRAQGGDLLFGERLAVGVRRRHAHRGPLGRHALHDFAGRRVAGHDRDMGTARLAGAGLGVQPQTDLAGGFVGAVATEAAVGKNRAHVAREIDAIGRGRRHREHYPDRHPPRQSHHGTMILHLDVN